MKIRIKVILCVMMFLSAFSSHTYANHFDISFDEIFENHSMVRVIIDADTGAIVRANKAAENFYGQSESELQQTNISNITMINYEETKKKWKSAIQESRNYYISKHRLSNGQIKDVEVHPLVFEHGGKEYLYIMVNDVTHKLELDKSLQASQRLTALLINAIFIIVVLSVILLYSSKEKYKNIAHHDYLTGAYSRLYLDKWKTRNERRNNTDECNISIIMIDVKDFKLINDKYGHVVGDEVLKKITYILKACIRENDVVIRYGGDEFLLILYNTTEEQSQMVMNRVESKLRTNGEFNFPIEISYGIHETISEANIFDVIKSADEEMYVMKSLSRI